jgi:hypothetical protein
MTEADYLLFEKYGLGELSSEENQYFEKRLKSDKAFLEAFDLYREVSSHLVTQIGNQNRHEIFVHNLKTISDNHFQTQKKETKTIPFKPWIYAVAAIALILITLNISVFNTHPSYADYNQFDTISLTVRSTNNEIYAEAEKAFNNKDYKTALTYFDAILKTDSIHNTEIKLYKAVALIETNSFAVADELLAQLTRENTVYKNQVLWYAALSKLKQKDYEACERFLHQISSDFDKYDKVRKLLKAL